MARRFHLLKRFAAPVTESLFFQPWIGADYAELQHQRDQGVLNPSVWAHPFHVLAESHYGSLDDYQRDFTQRVVEKYGYGRSRFFANILQIVTGEKLSSLDRREHWNKLAFSNFVQELMQNHSETPTEEQLERGRTAFPLQLALTRPQVLLVASQRLWVNWLAKTRTSRSGFDPGPMRFYEDVQITDNDAWVYHYSVAGRPYVTLAVYVIHPSAPAFKLEKAVKRAKTAAIFYSNIASGEEIQRREPLKID
jgi:hypothetical protein